MRTVMTPPGPMLLHAALLRPRAPPQLPELLTPELQVVGAQLQVRLLGAHLHWLPRHLLWRQQL